MHIYKPIDSKYIKNTAHVFFTCKFGRGVYRVYFRGKLVLPSPVVEVHMSGVTSTPKKPKLQAATFTPARGRAKASGILKPSVCHVQQFANPLNEESLSDRLIWVPVNGHPLQDDDAART